MKEKERAMSRYKDELEHLGGTADRVSLSLSEASTMMEAFEQEIKHIERSFKEVAQDVKVLEKGLSGGLKKAFDGVVFDGLKFSDALEKIANSMMKASYDAAVTPVTNQVGGMIAQSVGNFVQGVLPFGNGASQGGIGANSAPIAQSAANVVMNISTPDAASFARSRAQIAAQMNRALSYGQRNS
jgi:hypothetical protein